MCTMHNVTKMMHL